MLAEYFESPLRIQEIRGCPVGHLLEGFAQTLYEVGYAQLTARRHLRAAEHLVHWTAQRRHTSHGFGRAIRRGVFPPSESMPMRGLRTYSQAGVGKRRPFVYPASPACGRTDESDQ